MTGESIANNEGLMHPSYHILGLVNSQTERSQVLEYHVYFVPSDSNSRQVF